MKEAVCITFTAETLEGSEFTKDPNPTRFGIEQDELTAYRDALGLPFKSVAEIEPHEYIDIYAKKYWAPLKCSQLPNGVDLVVFQMGVNIGIGNAAEILQSVVEVPQDGHIGPVTLAAVKAMDPQLVIDGLLAQQQAYYNGIEAANPERNDKFSDGWARRIRETRNFLAAGKLGVVAGEVAASPAAIPSLLILILAGAALLLLGEKSA